MPASRGWGEIVPNEKGRILVVDDEPAIRDILVTSLSMEGHSCVSAEDGRVALSRLTADPFDLVITDIKMPVMDGLSLLRRLVADFPDTAVLMATSVADIGIAIEALTAGAYDYVIKPFNLKRLFVSAERALERRRLILENRRYQAYLEGRIDEQVDSIRRLYNAEQERTRELQLALGEIQSTYTSTLDALLNALDFRDNETQGHARRVVEYTMTIARELGLEGEILKTIEMGALLHDIGKIGIPDAILRKPGKLTDPEWVEMRRHVEYGYNMVKDIRFLREPAVIVLHHQERFDGTGYPGSLSGEAIHIGARIFAVADTYDAMTSDRPYRRALTYEDARAEIIRFSNSQFDPSVVESFLQLPRGMLFDIRSTVDEIFRRKEADRLTFPSVCSLPAGFGLSPSR